MMENYPTRIHYTTCEEACDSRDPTNVIPLADVGLNQTVEEGDPSALPAGYSTTTINVYLDDLLADPHSITVHPPGQYMADCLVCGAIGGTLSSGGNDVFIGLAEAHESGYAGTAWLHANANGTTTVTVFLVQGLFARPAPATLSAPSTTLLPPVEAPRPAASVTPPSGPLFKDLEPPPEDEERKRRRALGVLGTVAGGVVGIPLVLIWTILSIALPILVIGALVMGPGDSWKMVKAWVPGMSAEEESESEACRGYRDWLSAANERGGRAVALIEPVQKREVEDPATLRRIGTDLRNIANEELRSGPPPEANKLSSLFVEMYEGYAEAIDATVARDYTRYSSLEAEIKRLTTEGDAEDKRVRGVCM